MGMQRIIWAWPCRSGLLVYVGGATCSIDTEICGVVGAGQDECGRSYETDFARLFPGLAHVGAVVIAALASASVEALHRSKDASTCRGPL